MRAIAVGVGIVLGVCAAAPWAQAFSAIYDQQVTTGSQVVRGKVTMKDGLFRMEATIEGQETVTIHNASGTYTYLPQQGMAMKIPGLDVSQQPLEHAGDYQQYLQQRRAERTGTAVIDGHPCEIYRFTDPSFQGTMTAWVWTEKQFPIKMELAGPQGTTLVELTNVRLGSAVPESAFQLPAGAQVMDMGAMTGRP